MTPEVADLAKDRYLVAPEAMLVDGEILHGQAAVVESGVFLEVGPLEVVRHHHRDLDPVSLTAQLLMPGFVDAHHHLSQSFGTALAFGEPSEIFRRVWVPLEITLTEEELYASAKLAALESLRGGFTTVTDAGTRSQHDLSIVATATEEVGVRCVLPMVCNDIQQETLRARDVLAAAENHLARIAHRPLVHGSLAVTVPDAATEATMRAVVDLCRNAQVPLQVHVNEHLAGVERMLVGAGHRPLEYLDKVGALGPWLLAAHASLLTPKEMLMLRDRGAAVSYNPVATAWKGNAVCPALTLAELGVRLGLGTDGARSDGFRLLDAAETAQRLAFAMSSGDPYAGSGQLWMRAGTAGSADAAGLGQVTGRVAAGLAADFLLVDLSVPELVSSRDLVWELVRRGDRGQITMVVVAGRPRLVDGRPVDWDAGAFVEEARKLAATAVRRIHVPGDDG